MEKQPKFETPIWLKRAVLLLTLTTLLVACGEQGGTPAVILPTMLAVAVQAAESYCDQQDIEPFHFVGRTHLDGSDLQLEGCWGDGTFGESLGVTTFAYCLNEELALCPAGAPIDPDGYMNVTMSRFVSGAGEEGVLTEQAVLSYSDEQTATCAITAGEGAISYTDTPIYIECHPELGEQALAGVNQ